ncbi:MAG: hypothetical protein J6328_06750 [Bacilli bacterium]|nr:hypothetical protein [Bacilli bacterium]
MTKEEIYAYLAAHENGRYDRDHFDEFLAKKKFSFEIPAIHIAGTNGKGATAHYLESIYREAGYNAASYRSPFLYSPCEMMTYNGEHIGEETFVQFFNLSFKEFEKYDLSAFEIETYIAFMFILSKKPDIAIIECGMGGELDATNVFTPILSIITSVSLEHTSYLGRSVSEIAQSKGGIIKEEVPLLTGELGEAAKTVLLDMAEEANSPYHVVSEHHFVHHEDDGEHFQYGEIEDLIIHSDAEYQIANACIAIEAVDLLKNLFPVKEESLRAGLSKDELPLHIEKIGNFVLDGAHNPEAVEALVKSFPNFQNNRPVHVLFASFRDKNIAVELPMLGTYSQDITLTTFDHPRARDEMDYFLYIGDYPFVSSYVDAIKELEEKFPNDLILVTGSIAFAALVRKYLLERERK